MSVIVGPSTKNREADDSESGAPAGHGRRGGPPHRGAPRSGHEGGRTPRPGAGDGAQPRRSPAAAGESTPRPRASRTSSGSRWRERSPRWAQRARDGRRGTGCAPCCRGRVRGEGEPPRGAGDADPRKSLLRAGRGDSRGVPDGVPEPVQRGTPRCRSDGPDPRGGERRGDRGDPAGPRGGRILPCHGRVPGEDRAVHCTGSAGRLELQGRAVRPVGRGADRGARGRHRPGFRRGAVFEQNLQTLAADGRMVVIGTMGGAEVGRSACGPSCRSGF